MSAELCGYSEENDRETRAENADTKTGNGEE